jgi:putative heme-binding domain-containing protein
VRAEAARALSFYPTPEAADAVLGMAKLPMDYWLRYTVEHALGANEPVWRPGFLSGTLAKDNPAGREMMKTILASTKTGGAAAPLLQTLLSTEPKPAEEKNKAMTALSQLRGNPSRGREVFIRNCTSCHRVGNGEGQEYGPNLVDVGKRLNRFEIVESMIDPNAKVDMKYLSTRVDTLDGKTITGLLVSESKTELVIFDGKEKKTIKVDDVDKRQTLKQSSMPEGQAATMAPVEFLDLIEYMASLK